LGSLILTPFPSLEKRAICDNRQSGVSEVFYTCVTPEALGRAVLVIFFENSRHLMPTGMSLAANNGHTEGNDTCPWAKTTQPSCLKPSSFHTIQHQRP
jgi:hypothetical protein